MRFISYAQNFEDIMLWRALKDIKNGFYVDIGAAWPAQDSVTKAFYDRGWNGINIEPNFYFHTMLEKERPRDTNLLLAASNQPGQALMNFLDNSGLSTLDDSIAKGHQEKGWTIEKRLVQVETLADIFDKWIPKEQIIHFLKIDVEGLEKQVLQGNRWDHYRPWIVLIEATFPLSQVESYMAWEFILFQEDYIFAYADGLNRFYVAKEKSELLDVFKYPLDNFVLNTHIRLEEQVCHLQTALDGVYNSWSWRLTSPLRAFNPIPKLRLLKAKLWYKRH